MQAPSRPAAPPSFPGGARSAAASESSLHDLTWHDQQDGLSCGPLMLLAPQCVTWPLMQPKQALLQRSSIPHTSQCSLLILGHHEAKPHALWRPNEIMPSFHHIVHTEVVDGALADVQHIFETCSDRGCWRSCWINTMG